MCPTKARRRPSTISSPVTSTSSSWNCRRRSGCTKAAMRASSRWRPKSAESRDDIGRELILDEGNAIPQIELALFQPLDLQHVRPRGVLEGQNRGVEVAVLLQQARQLLPQVALFLLGHCHRWF